MKKFKVRFYEILLQEGIEKQVVVEKEVLLQEGIEKQVVVEKEVEADRFFIDDNCMCIFIKNNGNVAAFSSIISVELVKEGE